MSLLRSLSLARATPKPPSLLPRARLPPQLPRPHFSTKPSTPLCASCSRPLPSNLPACTACGSIRPLPPGLTHHALFGLPYDPNPFVVDLPLLKKHFREAQSACHPDAWASRSPKDGDLAHTLSSRLNEAHQTLLHPLARAEYILERNGLRMAESDQVEDMAFMMDIMEARETIDDASPDRRDTIEHLMESNQQNIKQTVDELTALVEQQDWPEVKAAAIRLRYLEGIKRAAKKWMDNHI